MKITRTCARKGCNQTFKPRTSLQKYCSPECAYSEKKKNDSNKRSQKSNKPTFKKCKHCGEEFNPYNSLQKFCSFKCSSEHERSKRSRNWTPEQRANIKGSKNPNFKSGIYKRDSKKDRTGDRLFEKNKKTVKRNIIKRDGFLHCEICNRTHALQFETHHLIFRSEKPNHEHLHDVSNLIYLCINCHNEFHTDKGKRNDIVKERQLHLLFGSDILNK